jgi:hypothetical protein
MGHRPLFDAGALQGVPVRVFARHLGLAFITAPMTVQSVQRWGAYPPNRLLPSTFKALVFLGTKGGSLRPP